MLTTIRFSKNDLKEVRNVRYKTFNAKVKVMSVAVLLAACFIAYMYVLKTFPVHQIALEILNSGI